MLGNGLPISTIHKRCDEDGGIIEDGTMHVIINYSLDYLIKNAKLRGLATYCKTKKVTNELTKEVDDMVEGVKLDAKARNEYHFLFNRYPDFILKAMKEGEQKGIEKGSYTKAIETARNLIEMGLSRKDIVKATGLPMEEIAKL